MQVFPGMEWKDDPGLFLYIYPMTALASEEPKAGAKQHSFGFIGC
jgi:hypothetical protein